MESLTLPQVEGRPPDVCGMNANPGVQPERDGRVSQVVRPGRQGRVDLVGRERVGSSFLPDLRVGRAGDHVACPGPKQSPIVADAVPADMVAEDAHQFRRNGYRPGDLLVSVLQAALVMPLAGVGEPLIALRCGLFQREQTRAVFGKVTVLLAESARLAGRRPPKYMQANMAASIDPRDRTK
ncbi:hypothetical protein [Microtetraspora niveoalba]|uniref:hypothetical protein n=1 Tax=Microtetraspora niveoalba TaxID=46175 RepID=UPI001471F006|nr:hypothetical protein [Microtetraspora niveoalba]